MQYLNAVTNFEALSLLLPIAYVGSMPCENKSSLKEDQIIIKRAKATVLKRKSFAIENPY